MWFKNLMGFEEISPEDVRENIIIQNEKLISKVNGKEYQFGKLEIPSLEELRNAVDLESFSGEIQISELVGNVKNFHCDENNKNALFQTASQFNLLEMASPEVIPELGVGIYENDYTQGPACAIACGAGTIYRNYFVPLNGKIGQTKNNQIDCLEQIDDYFKNEELNLWNIKNGYCFPSEKGLEHIESQISKMTTEERETLKGKLKVGIQWNSEVTIANPNQMVSQIYCSALPIGYSSYIPANKWENFARIILEATYEATFYAGLINLKENKNNQIFLTLVGGGVFGNKIEWILDAVSKSVAKFRNTDLNVKIVSYGYSNEMVNQMISDLNR